MMTLAADSLIVPFSPGITEANMSAPLTRPAEMQVPIPQQDVPFHGILVEEGWH
jgi:hypothetical protein